MKQGNRKKRLNFILVASVTEKENSKQFARQTHFDKKWFWHLSSKRNRRKRTVVYLNVSKE